MDSHRDLSPPIPDLRIVPVANVLPHEEHDPQRSEPLIERIRQAGTWLNPPIVAPIKPDNVDNQRYVVLDGANRHFCVRALGYPHILVQVIDYSSPNIHLEAWNHVLSNVETDDLIPEVHKVDGVQVVETDRANAEAHLSDHSAIGYVRVLPDEIMMLVPDQFDVPTRSAKLRELVNIYKNIAKLDRINSDHPDVVRRMYPNAAAVVAFPTYSPDEITAAARDGHRLPPGISRHIIQGRAMRLHYPLEAMQDLATPLDEKNAALRKWMQDQVAKRHVRLYAEATYIFDD
jgi:hypothetical protein